MNSFNKKDSKASMMAKNMVSVMTERIASGEPSVPRGETDERNLQLARVENQKSAAKEL